MANPRQRRKAKSASHSAVSHSRRAKKLLKKMPAIRGPQVLQDAWDKSKTVRQNYIALGLQHTLNPVQSGGSEREMVYNKCTVDSPDSKDLSPTSVPPVQTPLPESSAGPSTQVSGIPKGFGRIIRDSAGNVLRIEIPDPEDTHKEATDDADMNGLEEAQLDEHILESWAGRILHRNPEQAQQLPESRSDVVVALETLSSSVNPTPRHTSSGERSYLSRLARQYNDDYEKMARDRRLNPEQKTAGELKRAIKRAGGVNGLLDDQNES
ncbi:hypothetical protein BV22DRAFT_1029173 [Leucogyrophana mollusca]|uniref:Uncharacterized protein n=1 Tax=Leucogyrophana mollusca TaxID=85980 RepID=A0ACB8BWM5_9AGAM|nr:hypothetical protein BV22DRAFT_1029173 [Leucogyrophana mollusca]